MNKLETAEAIWADIVGFEGIYQVSNIGEMRRIAKNDNVGPLDSPRPVLACKRPDGYQLAILYKNRKAYTRYVHRLVAQAFIKPINGYNCVNHLDSNRANNKASNIEWCTPKMNTKHAFKNGRMNPARGEQCHSAKLKEHQARRIKYGYIGLIDKEVANMYGVSRQCVQSIRSGKNWRHV